MTRCPKKVLSEKSNRQKKVNKKYYTMKKMRSTFKESEVLFKNQMK